MVAVSAKVKKKRPKKSKSKSPHAAEGSGYLSPYNEPTLAPALPNHDTAPPITLETDKPVLLKESTVSSSSQLSLDSVNDDGHSPMYVALTTANDFVSGDAMAAVNATALVLSASTPLPAPAKQESSPPKPNTTISQAGPGDFPTISETNSRWGTVPVDDEGSSQQQPANQTGRFSPDSEMRTAMLTLSKMKDDLELQNRYMHVH